MLRVSTKTTGRTWLIRPGEATFINTMVTALTGKKGRAQRAQRRKTVSKYRTGPPGLNRTALFFQRAAIICESWMSPWRDLIPESRLRTVNRHRIAPFERQTGWPREQRGQPRY